MRQLVIVCDAVHVKEIRHALETYGHPEAVKKLIDIYPVDMLVEIDYRQAQREIIALLAGKNTPFPLTDLPLLCATREPGKVLKLASLARAMSYEYEAKNARDLCKVLPHGQGTPNIGRLLNQCSLGVRTFSASVLNHWSHGQLDHQWIEQWVQQFGRLGKLSWLGEELLRNLRMIDAAQLGMMLLSRRQENEAAICINRDPRTTGKSGDVIANLIKKQTSGRVYDSPAEAIERGGHKKIVLFEDGLWSGTEAIGVLESLLGIRDQQRLKTRPLLDPTNLQRVDLELAYGIATDYAESLVRHFLQTKGLARVNIVATERIQVADSHFIEAIGKGEFKTEQLWDEGPPAQFMKPHLMACLENSAMLDTERKGTAREFCREIGQQLFDNYLNSMQKLQNWAPWPDIKRQKCGLGMYGIGLLHAFGHSVPKASSPLLWGSGKVTWKGVAVEWRPLFEHAAENA